AAHAAASANRGTRDDLRKYAAVSVEARRRGRESALRPRILRQRRKRRDVMRYHTNVCSAKSVMLVAVRRPRVSRLSPELRSPGAAASSELQSRRAFRRLIRFGYTGMPLSTFTHRRSENTMAGQH